MSPDNSPHNPLSDPKEALRINNLVDSAASSMEKVKLENHLADIKSCLEGVTGKDWGELKSLLAKENLADEQEQAIAATISMVQTMRAVSSDEKQIENLRRFAKQSGILEVAIADRVFRERILPFRQTDNIGLMCSAATHLLEALASVSNKYNVDEALQLGGRGMSNDEVENAKARVKRLTIK